MLLGILSVWLLFFQSAAWSVQNSLELHSGTVKIIRSGKSQILQKAGETYSLSANDRLQTGGNTQVTLYLNDRDNMVKLFSHSFFKLDDISEQENNVALFTGKANFSVKPLPGSSGAGEDESKIGTRINLLQGNSRTNWVESLKEAWQNLENPSLVAKKSGLRYVRFRQSLVCVEQSSFLLPVHFH